MMRKARLATRKVNVALDSPGYCFGTGTHPYLPVWISIPLGVILGIPIGYGFGLTIFYVGKAGKPDDYYE